MIRGLWDRETVALMVLASLLPLTVMWLQVEGVAALGRLIFFLVFAGIWHVVFMLARAQPPSFAGAVTALAIAILVPRELNIVQVLLGLSFGVVMAELVFGGWGRNILNPATVMLSFVGFGFPQAPWPDLIAQIGWAAIPAALLGWLTGVFSIRIILGALVVFGIAHFAGVDFSEIYPAVAVVLVLLVCDPVASASTQLGRWLYGALFAGLIVLFAVYWQGAAAIQISIAAALLANLCAPILDEAAIASWLALRRRNLG